VLLGQRVAAPTVARALRPPFRGHLHAGGQQLGWVFDGTDAEGMTFVNVATGAQTNQLVAWLDGKGVA